MKLDTQSKLWISYAVHVQKACNFIRYSGRSGRFNVRLN